METEIDLNEYDVVKDRDGIVVLVDKEYVFLQNKQNKNILKVPHNIVASYYELGDLKEKSSVEVVPAPSPFDRFKWDKNMTKFMLDLYLKLMNSVGLQKQFKTKKLLWLHIAGKINKTFNKTLTAVQVETRYKCIVRRKIDSVENHMINEALKPVTNDPLDVETKLSANKIYYENRKLSVRSSSSPLKSSTPLKPSTSLKSSTQVEQEHNYEDEVRHRNKGKSMQEKMFEQFLKQREEHFRIREENRMDREKEKLANSRERHSERTLFMKDLLDKIYNK